MNSKLKGIIILILVILCVYIMIVPGSSYERINIVGSTSVQPLGEKLAETYTENNNVLINVQGGGSGMGIRSSHQNITDIGMSSKELNNEEKKELEELILGQEGIVISVNNENNVNDLNIGQIKNIFSGKIRNWKEVGGKDLNIEVITREEGSGTRSAFEDLVMEDSKIKADAIVQSSTESVKQSIVSNPGAIGFVSYAHMSDDVKSLLVDGVDVSEETIADKSYKLQRPFIFLINGEPKDSVKEFLQWVYSPEGIKIIKEEKIVPPNSTQILKYQELLK
ncbi:phosphate ABC transporter substrate-binding protein [Methanobrevibacter filiformis]|uniref:Phosphate-binding protein PstS 1 n=1 Tax=Methanobrevibacter filiformis TaxID=55758 RepID=A0A166CA04_9EURY|nr:phosphate ABC transporter substrate-binding protein [Methanobrevibacter filiformis]KZX12577.1 phosphate-binding protein PstS 1 precursor [Methanobrevibacter filiformis]